MTVPKLIAPMTAPQLIAPISVQSEPPTKHRSISGLGASDRRTKIGPSGGRFLFLLHKLGLDLKDVAFTNLAKCFTDSDNTPFLKACLCQVDNDRRLLCPHPYFSALQKLIERLAPLAVFVQQSSYLTRPLIRRLKIPGKIWQFDNRTGALYQADGKPKILWSENWWLQAVTDYKEMALKYGKPS